MLTRCQAWRWLRALDPLKDAAEAAPVQSDQLQAVSLRPARALPLRLDRPLEGGLVHTDRPAALGRDNHFVRSNDIHDGRW